MTLRLDHLAVAAASLTEGVAALETALGVPLADGGAHPLMGTHNRLLGMGDIYLEVIAIDPGAPPPGRARWFALDDFTGPPRLTNWIVACDDLETALHDAPEGHGRPVALSRGDLRWRMAVPDDGQLPHDQCTPALIQWESNAHPATRLPDSGLRLKHLQVTHPQAAAICKGLPGFGDPRVSLIPGPRGMRAVFTHPDGQEKVLEG